MQSWCRTWPPNGCSHIRAKQKLLRKHKGACKSSWSPIGNLKSFTLTSLWNLAKLVKISLGIMALRHHTDQKQMGLLKEHSERRHLCCIVAIRSEWKLVGRFHGMLHLSAKRHRSSIWWEDALWKTFWATTLRTNHSIWFIGWVLPYICEGPVKNPSIWKESLTWIVPRIRSVRGRGIWKGDTLVADIEELETMDASEIYSKRLNAKEVIFPKQGEFIFPIADGRIKTPGGDQELRTSTLTRHRPIQGESNIDFLGESEGSLPQPHDSLPDAGEAMNDFWSMSGNFIYRRHVEPRQTLLAERRIIPCSTEIHWRLQNYTYKFGY